MAQLNPEILKRSLPANVHATIDQVSANVDNAVDAIVKNFLKSANDAADRFEKGEFSAELRRAIDQSKAQLLSDYANVTLLLKNLEAAIVAAQTLAADANKKASDLNTVVADMNTASTQLKTELAAFRDKVDKFASKSGGMIASAAVRTFTGGALG